MEQENTGSPSPRPQSPAPVSRRKALMLGAAGAALGLNTLSARGQARRDVKLAVLTDFSSAYSVNQGYGIVSGIELAVYLLALQSIFAEYQPLPAALLSVAGNPAGMRPPSPG